MQSPPPAANPTAALDLDFVGYIERRKQEISAHLQGSIPDYSFGMDAVLRRRLATMGPIRSLAKLIVSATVPINRQQYLMSGVLVGPRQYPEFHALTADCARILGIGVPQVFIVPDASRNAFTWATDDVAPLIVVTTGLIEALDPLELKFVIGHECGHIHNLHGIYNATVEIMVNPLARTLLTQMISFGIVPGSAELIFGLVRGGLQLFMLQWSRCAEITCDRAGVICCGELEAAQRALVKLIIGGNERLQAFNIEEYLKQLDQIQALPVRFLEIGQTHPLIPRRIRALRVFSECEMMKTWRSDWKALKAPRSKEEADWICAQIIDVVKGRSYAA
jgi:Zn-dependent protease with chaperone function